METVADRIILPSPAASYRQVWILCLHKSLSVGLGNNEDDQRNNLSALGPVTV